MSNVQTHHSDIDEDNFILSWGHYQFTAGGLNVLSSMTSWHEIGSITTAFKIVAAALKTCQDAQVMCTNAGLSNMASFLSNTYLEKVLESVEICWVGTGGVHAYILF